MERRLAAVLAADVAGYTRLMEADEAGTLAALKHRHEVVLEPLVARYAGRVVNVAGDGVLVEFPGAVNAIRCAVDLQHQMSMANAELSEDRAVVLRVGVNLGDVMVEDSDLFGDGVNIAARLQALAAPGEVYLSGKVHDEVGGKVDLKFEDQGEIALKNVSRPVRIFRVVEVATAAMGIVASPSRVEVAVLPFVDLSGGAERQYFCAGVTEDIITELTRFRQLAVRSPHSSFRHREPIDLRRAARELGVEHVVQGSVRHLGNQLRVNIQLIHAPSGERLWAERFDGSEEELFSVQDQVVRTIAATLVGRLEAAGTERAMRKLPASLAAYECVLRGTALGDADAIAEARHLFERAIALDSGYGRAHARLAHALYLQWFRDMAGPIDTLDRALELARRAVALDDADNVCHDILGWIYLNRGSFELAEFHKRRALELNPDSPEQVACTGVLYTFLGRAEEAVEWFARARCLDPYFEPSWYWSILGIAHFTARRLDEAIAHFDRSPTMPWWVRAYLAASHALAGRAELAQALAAEVLHASPGCSAARFSAKEPFRRPEDRECLREGLEKAGLPP